MICHWNRYDLRVIKSSAGSANLSFLASRQDPVMNVGMIDTGSMGSPIGSLPDRESARS